MATEEASIPEDVRARNALALNSRLLMEKMNEVFFSFAKQHRIRPDQARALLQDRKAVQ